MGNIIDFQAYIEATDRTAVYPGVNTGNVKELSYIGLGFHEAGEVGGTIKKIVRLHGDEDDWDEFAKVPQALLDKAVLELGDGMWYIARFIKFLQKFDSSIDLNEILMRNVTKLQGRKEAGTLKMRDGSA